MLAVQSIPGIGEWAPLAVAGASYIAAAIITVLLLSDLHQRSRVVVRRLTFVPVFAAVAGWLVFAGHLFGQLAIAGSAVSGLASLVLSLVTVFALMFGGFFVTLGGMAVTRFALGGAIVGLAAAAPAVVDSLFDARLGAPLATVVLAIFAILAASAGALAFVLMAGNAGRLRCAGAGLMLAAAFALPHLAVLRQIDSISMTGQAVPGPAVIAMFAALFAAATIAIVWQAYAALAIDRRWDGRIDLRTTQMLALFNGTLFGLTSYDRDGRLLLYNEHFKKLYGFGDAALRPGMPFADVLAGECRRSRIVPDAHALMMQIKATGSRCEPFEHTLHFDDGRYIAITTTPTRDGGWISAHRDVTELHTQAAELANIKNFLDTVIEHVPNPIFVRDATDARCVLLNRAAEDLLSRRREDVLGRTPEETEPATAAAWIRKREREVITSRTTQRYEHHTIASARGPRDVVVTKVPVFGKSGKVRYVLTINHDLTERNRQTRELNETKKFLDTVIESVPVPIVVRDAKDFRCVLVNRAGEESGGYRRADWIGRTLEQIYPAPMAQEIRALDAAVAESGVASHLAERTVDTPRGPRVVTSHKVPIFGDDGSVRFVLSVMNDITERHHQAKELEEVKSFLDLVIDNIPVGIIVRDARDSRCVLVNHAAEIIHGIARADVIGKTPAEIVAPELAATIIAEDKGLLETGQPIEIPERSFRTPSGERRVAVRRLLVKDAEGRPKYVIAVVEDIAERVRRSNELAEVKSFLDTIIESVPVGILVRDAKELRMAFVNRAAEALHGFKRADVIGKTLAEIYLPAVAAPLHIEDQLLLENGRSLPPFEKVLQMPDGRAPTLSVRRLVANDGAGRPKYLITVTEDISERARQTRELAEIKTFLDTIIESVPVSITVKDAKERRFILINRAAEQMLGVSRDNLIGKTAADIYPDREEWRAEIEQQDRDLLATRDPIFLPEKTLTPFGGAPRVVRAIRQTVMGDDGEPRYLMTVAEDVTDRKEAEARLTHMAGHDALTDLANRAAFNQHLIAALDQAAVTQAPLALMCIDLDHFKDINDVYGHVVGDVLLQQVGTALARAAPDAFMARLGGDEFAAVMMGEVTPDSASQVADRLMDAVAVTFAIAGHELRTGLSIGIALYPTDGADAIALLANADAALYRAKVEGRGSVRFCEPDMDKRLRDQRALAQDLRLVIEREEMLLNYQPLARLDGTIVGFEALARWKHPFRGFIPPDQFIPLAEESGVILEIGEWVLRTACREAASWPQPLSVAVNVSTVQFRHGDLVELVHTVLLETGLQPSRLELEVTESVLIDDLARALSILRRLKSLGVRIAMDDFGTGYSSLSNLQAFAFDKIKIDRSFIMNLETNSQSATIVRMVLALGRGLGLPVLAEGVETAQQRAFLTEEGCTQLQGYLIGKPQPIEAYAAAVGRADRGLRAVG